MNHLRHNILLSAIVFNCNPTNLFGADSPLEKFKVACSSNDLFTIKAMLNKKAVTSAEAGMAVFNLGDNIKPEGIEVIAKTYPYAVWDAQRPLLNRYPCFTEKYIKTCFKQGFILPYQRFHSNAVSTATSILIYAVASRDVIKPEPERVLSAPHYDLIELVLQKGANPHYKDSFYALMDSDRKEDAYFFCTNTITPEEGPKIKELLDKYARGPINDKGEFNTTDQFYPGTPGYRAKNN